MAIPSRANSAGTNRSHCPFTTAVGVASFPHTAHSQEALLEAALAALDEARRRGGNSVTLAAIRFDAV